MEKIEYFFDKDLNNWQKGVFCLLISVIFYINYRYKLNEEKRYGPLSNWDKYRSISSIKSLFVIIVFAVISIFYFLK